MIFWFAKYFVHFFFCSRLPFPLISFDALVLKRPFGRASSRFSDVSPRLLAVFVWAVIDFLCIVLAEER